MHTERGDDVAIIKRRRQDLHRDGIRDPVMASGRGRLKEDLESSMWRRHHDYIYKTDFRVLEDNFWETKPSCSSSFLGEANPIRTLGDYSKPIHKDYRNTIELLKGNNEIHDRNAKESWAFLEDLALYDNESWNDPRNFAKPVKEISLPQDVPSTSDRRLIELENQVQRLIEAHLAPKKPI
ncbi:hypothetical protein Tco_1287219 [Tanacetum coccineum]